MIKLLLNMKILRILKIKNKSRRNKKRNRSKRKFKHLKTFLLFLLTINRKISYNDRSSIVLESGQKIARQTKTGDGRFVFSNYHITSNNQKIIFKIKNLKNWIGLGVAIRDKIKYLNFRFECIY